MIKNLINLTTFERIFKERLLLLLIVNVICFNLLKNSYECIFIILKFYIIFSFKFITIIFTNTISIHSKNLKDIYNLFNPFYINIPVIQY